MIAIAATAPNSILKFPTLLQREGGALANADHLTLRAFYNAVLLPEIRCSQSPGSLKEDRTALNHWERITDNPDLRDVNRSHLALLRDTMVSENYPPSTINKTWRELKSILEAAKEDEVIDKVPAIGRRMKCRLLNEPAKQQREPVTEAELERLWIACKHATYPRGGQFPAPLLWRKALVLWWTYGQRTMDVLRTLTWQCCWWSPMVLRFEAMKTKKVQGLPITPIVEKHLRAFRGHSDRMFPGFNSPGCELKTGKKAGTVKRGYYLTWNREICANAGIVEPLDIKHFRERAVTYYNGVEAGLGGWIAGHYMPGVTAQNYDLPTKRIRDAICSTPVPACFTQLD